MKRDFSLILPVRPARSEWIRVTGLLALLLMSALAWQRPHAATVGRLTMSALVFTRCQVRVNVVDGMAAVSNLCGAVPNGAQDGRAFLLVDQQARSVLVVY